MKIATVSKNEPSDQDGIDNNLLNLSLCCEKLKQHLGETIIERTNNNEWHINGCCGGCYVITDIEHCPFCGAELQ